jgi:hypothetical protein
MRTSLPAQFTEWLKACNERFARFSGSQFSSDELPQDQKPAAADSEKALTRGAICSFKCLLCGRSMRDAGERWECRCGFSYKPLVAWYNSRQVPARRYHGKEALPRL